MKKTTLVELIKPEIEISLDGLKNAYEFLNNSDYIVSIHTTHNFLFFYINNENQLKQIPIASNVYKVPFLLKNNYKFISFYSEDNNKIKLKKSTDRNGNFIRTFWVGILETGRLSDFKCETKQINKIYY